MASGTVTKGFKRYTVSQTTNQYSAVTMPSGITQNNLISVFVHDSTNLAALPQKNVCRILNVANAPALAGSGVTVELTYIYE